MYVAIEGIDTCGKSTQIAELKKIYPHAIFTREPGGSELGLELREILLKKNLKVCKEAEVLLFLADRAEHTSEVLLPNQNKLIIADRSLISGIAYAKDFAFEILKTLNLFATSGVLPSKIVFLEISKEALRKRLKDKENDKIEMRGIEYLLDLQARIKEAILKLGICSLSLDAGLTKEKITERIVEFIGKCDV